MSSANLELVRSIYTAWERGDWSSAAWADPEIEYAMADGPSAETRIGLAGMSQLFADWLSAWDGWTVTAEGYRELDGDRVLVLFTFDARGRASGIEVGQMAGARGATVFQVRDGKVVKVAQYFDRAHAFADLGLTPEAG